MSAAISEFMESADMIGMAVGRHRDQGRTASKRGHQGCEGPQAHAEIDQEIGIASAQQKDVGPEKTMHVRLIYPEQSTAEVGDGEPAVRHDFAHAPAPARLAVKGV